MNYLNTWKIRYTCCVAPFVRIKRLVSTFRLVDCLLPASICNACATLLVDKTLGSLARFDNSTLCRYSNCLILSEDAFCLLVILSYLLRRRVICWILHQLDLSFGVNGEFFLMKSAQHPVNAIQSNKLDTYCLQRFLNIFRNCRIDFGSNCRSNSINHNILCSLRSVRSAKSFTTIWLSPIA